MRNVFVLLIVLQQIAKYIVYCEKMRDREIRVAESECDEAQMDGLGFFFSSNRALIV